MWEAWGAVAGGNDVSLWLEVAGLRGALRVALTLALAGGVAGVGRRLLQRTPERPRLHPGLRHLLL